MGAQFLICFHMNKERDIFHFWCEGTGREREKVKGFAHMTLKEGRYEAKMLVPASFGPVGAVLVENEHHREMFIKNIKLITGGDESTAITFDVDSWVHSKFDNPEPRVFFTIKVIKLCMQLP